MIATIEHELGDTVEFNVTGSIETGKIVLMEVNRQYYDVQPNWGSTGVVFRLLPQDILCNTSKGQPSYRQVAGSMVGPTTKPKNTDTEHPVTNEVELTEMEVPVHNCICDFIELMQQGCTCGGK